MSSRSRSDEMAGFGALLSALGGDKGKLIFPPEDAADFAKGAASIPSQVTEARRLGERVEFIQAGGPKDWYWCLPDGTKVR